MLFRSHRGGNGTRRLASEKSVCPRMGSFLGEASTVHHSPLLPAMVQAADSVEENKREEGVAEQCPPAKSARKQGYFLSGQPSRTIIRRDDPDGRRHSSLFGLLPRTVLSLLSDLLSPGMMLLLSVHNRLLHLEGLSADEPPGGNFLR